MELYDTIAGLSLSKKMFISASEKGAANGVATLNANGKVPETQLPSYVDDIVEGYLYEGSFYEDPEHTTEIQGETGKIYVDIVTNRSYRWSGSAYVEIGDNDEYTEGRALVSDANGKIAASDITTEELATLDDITGNIQEQINGKISSTEKGAANGLATLDANGKVTDIQLPTVTANKALVSDENGITSASSVTSTELGYVSGVTSAIQTQISGKQNAITGAASSITSTDLTASRALMSNASGKVDASAVTAIELGYVSGVTSAIQTQIDGKQASITGAASTIATSDLTASRALVSNSSGKVSASSITSTKLGYLTDVTSNIQSQIDGKQASITGAASSIVSSDLTASRALVSDISGKVSASYISSTKLGYLTDVTGNIQNQIDGKQASITGAASTITSSDLTASRALVSNSSGKVSTSSITSTKLGYLTDVTSNIQSQIDGKQASITGAATSITSSDLTASRALISDSSGKVSASSITSTKLGYLSGVTSSVQTQLDAKGDTLDFDLNTRVLSLKRGSTVLSSVTIPLIKIVPFSSGSDAEIMMMLDAYYNGQITWSQMGWHIGDTRKIHLDAMQAPNPNSSNTWAEQDITLAIVAHDHTSLETSINGFTKGCITVQTREVLNNNTSGYGTSGHMYVKGVNYITTSFSPWSSLYMRTYLNDKVWGAMPNSFKAGIKKSSNYRHTTYNGTASEQVVDYIFLPSYAEVFGTASYSSYVPTSPVEGTQYEYYATASNRIKYGNNNGSPNSTPQYWWNGSAASLYDSNGYYWCRVNTNGTASCGTGNNAYALAPAFVM